MAPIRACAAPVGDYDFDYGEYGYGDSGRRGGGSRRPSHGRPSSRGPKKPQRQQAQGSFDRACAGFGVRRCGRVRIRCCPGGQSPHWPGFETWTKCSWIPTSRTSLSICCCWALTVRQSATRTGDFGGTYRSDSIMLARIDPVEDKATLVSLHRDTLLDMGEYGNQKLNAAYALGGPSYMVETVSKLGGRAYFALRGSELRRLQGHRGRAWRRRSGRAHGNRRRRCGRIRGRRTANTHGRPGAHPLPRTPCVRRIRRRRLVPCGKSATGAECHCKEGSFDGHRDHDQHGSRPCRSTSRPT